jgi:PDZ domain-containing protein
VIPIALLALLAIGAAFVPLSYYELAPGSARPIGSLVRVEGTRTYPPRGEVLLTTVSLGRVRNVYEAVDGWLDPDVDVLPERDILGTSSRREYQQQSFQAMVDSKQSAALVALRKLGYPASVSGEGALVVEVLEQYPVAKVLRPGDVITSLDGAAIHLDSDLVSAIRVRHPGDVVHLVVTRANQSGAARAVDVRLAARDDGSALLGIQLQTYNEKPDLPFTVDIDSGRIGGPSAGLAFTLTVLDLLTPGELTGGVKVAATGTIDIEGKVGPVGGVAQKAVAVRRAGAKLFLVPSAEYAEAVAHAGHGLRIAKVDTLDDALEVLGTLRGSNALALGLPGRETG